MTDPAAPPRGPAEDINALQELDAQATPGPWSLGDVDADGYSAIHPPPMPGWPDPTRCLVVYADQRDGPLIVAMRNALPGLLAELTQLREGHEWVTSALFQEYQWMLGERGKLDKEIDGMDEVRQQAEAKATYWEKRHRDAQKEITRLDKEVAFLTPLVAIHRTGPTI